MASAIPVDKDTPIVGASLQQQDSAHKSLQSNPVPLSKAPLSPSTVDLHPLHKRDAPKTQTSSDVNTQKLLAATVTNAQKSDSNKPATDIRKTRENPQTTAAPAKQAQPVTQASPKRQRQVPKTDADLKKTPTNQQATPLTSSAPQVARVPLASTNSRSRRDAPKVTAAQVPVMNVKADSAPIKTNNPPAQANNKPKRDSPANVAQTQSNNSQGIRKPAPVDQVLKQKAATTAA